MICYEVLSQFFSNGPLPCLGLNGSPIPYHLPTVSYFIWGSIIYGRKVHGLRYHDCSYGREAVAMLRCRKAICYDESIVYCREASAYGKEVVKVGKLLFMTGSYCLRFESNC